MGKFSKFSILVAAPVAALALTVAAPAKAVPVDAEILLLMDVSGSVYTIPAYSQVGLTEEKAEEQGLKVRVSTNDMSGWFSGRSYAETTAWSKILIDEDSDGIVGAHMIGHNGEDLINLFVLAMRNDIPASALKDTILAYPTFSSDVNNMY